jgi:hypothetical protein
MANRITLIDATGKFIAQDTNCNKLQMGTDLSSGIYFLQVTSGNETASFKIIK